MMWRGVSTTSMWDDIVRQRFEMEHWLPLEREVQVTQREMERLAQVVAQARRSVR